MARTLGNAPRDGFADGSCRTRDKGDPIRSVSAIHPGPRMSDRPEPTEK